MTNQPDLSIGSMAPEFSLPASTGTQISLSDYRDKSNLYLFFVREFN